MDCRHCPTTRRPRSHLLCKCLRGLEAAARSWVAATRCSALNYRRRVPATRTRRSCVPSTHVAVWPGSIRVQVFDGSWWYPHHRCWWPGLRPTHPVRQLWPPQRLRLRSPSRCNVASCHSPCVIVWLDGCVTSDRLVRFRKADPLVTKSNLTAFQPLPRPSCETQILSPVCVVVAKPISAGRPIRWLPSTTRCSRNSLGPGSTNDHLDSLQPIGRSRAPSGRTQRGGHLVGDRPGELGRPVEVGAQPLLGGRDVDGGDDVSTEPVDRRGDADQTGLELLVDGPIPVPPNRVDVVEEAGQRHPRRRRPVGDVVADRAGRRSGGGLVREVVPPPSDRLAVPSAQQRAARRCRVRVDRRSLPTNPTECMRRQLAV